MVKNIVIALVLFVFALVWFMPKAQIYYKIEEVLKTKGVVINEANITESMFGVTIEGGEIYAKGIRVATFDKAKLFTLLFRNTLKIDNITPDTTIASVVPKNVTIPKRIDRIAIKHNVITPKTAILKIGGSFGQAQGKLDGSNRVLRLDFTETTDEFKTLQSFLTKGEEGWYYEQSF